MKNITEFSQTTIEELNCYVYALRDETTNKIVYVGKGQGNRVFESLRAKSEVHGNKLTAHIVRHKLTENEAEMLEAATMSLLRYVSFSDLKFNIQDGIYNKDLGMNSVEGIEMQYNAPEIDEKDFKHDVLVISINKSMHESRGDGDPSPVKIYENTRKAWVLDKEKAKKVKYVMAKHNGVIKEIYEAEEWEPYPEGEGKKPRWGFVGDVVKNPEVREFYIGKKISKRGYGNPINYVIGNELTNEEGLEEDN